MSLDKIQVQAFPIQWEEVLTLLSLLANSTRIIPYILLLF